MAEPTPEKSLELARKHLDKVMDAWDDPTDWMDLSTYGLYALEAAVMAAAAHVGLEVKRTHWAKADASDELADKHSLPAVSDLMEQLNTARKSEAYGDIDTPEDLDAETVATQVEEYVEAVAKLLENDPPEAAP